MPRLHCLVGIFKMAANPVPQSLKSVAQFLMISRQFSKRNPVVSYYSLMYFVQQGIPLCKGDIEAKGFLSNVMKELEEKKRSLSGDEALQNEMVAQATIEEVALTHFDAADNKDRLSQYNMQLSKLFFLCSRLFQILEQFGDLSDEIKDKMKYSKYKAVNISQCLNSGVTPTPGPPGGWGQDDDEVNPNDGTTMSQPPQYGFNSDPPSYSGGVPPTMDDYRPVPVPRRNIPSPNSSPGPQRHNEPVPMPYNPPQPSYNLVQSPQPSYNPVPPPQPSYNPQPVSPPTGAELTEKQITLVQKYCKFAASSMDYNDKTSAIDNLEKALRLLKTGRDS